MTGRQPDATPPSGHYAAVGPWRIVDRSRHECADEPFQIVAEVGVLCDLETGLTNDHVARVRTIPAGLAETVIFFGPAAYEHAEDHYWDLDELLCRD